MKPFQLVILGIFGLFAVIGVIMFATFRGPDSGIDQTPVTLWGTLPSESIRDAVSKYNTDTEDSITIVYTEFNPDEFDESFTEALAESRGPDLVLLPHDSILRHQAKIAPLRDELYPERDFKDTFIELGELLITPEGTAGLPFVVDPMVMYWNRDIFSSAGLSLPPRTWEELLTMASRLTNRDEQNNILKSTIALGSFQNITHAKNILTMLFMQAGDPIVVRDTLGNLNAVFGGQFGLSESPAESALRFYTEFANPVRTLYSWNRSFPESKEVFLAGDLALYLGLASEMSDIRAKNPNLNFDVVLVPQAATAEDIKTYGNMHALSLVRASRNTGPAFRAMLLMTQPEFFIHLEEELGLPPVRRDMLSVQTLSPELEVFYRAALIADAFIDPDNEATESVFKRMVEDVSSGRNSISQSIANAREELSRILP